MTLVGTVVPQGSGPVALLAVLAPFAYGAVVVALTPMAVVRRDAILATAVAVAGIVAVLAYRSPAPLQATGGEPELTILTWNLHGEPVAEVGFPSILARVEADVVVLQEAGPDAASALATDMRVMRRPDAATPPGMILATRLPVLATGELTQPAAAWDRPRAFWLSVEAPSGPVTIVGAHLSFPMPLDSLPCPYCPLRRDAQVAELARFAAERQAAGERVVVAGDFNLTEREVAYADLVGGLRDTGRGLSWRPLGVSWLPPMLRLDYVHIGPGLGVVASETDCGASRSDHCPVWVRLGT